MTLEITTSAIVIAVVAIVAAIGWFLAYKEYANREADSIRHLASLTSLAEAGQRDVNNLEVKRHEEVKALKAELASALDIRESEITESEKLIRDHIEEIESVYKGALEESNTSLELYEKYIKNFDAAITLTSKKLVDLDTKGLFASDDEIGFFFNYVRDLQSVLSKFKVEKEILDQNTTEQEVVK